MLTLIFRLILSFLHFSYVVLDKIEYRLLVTRKFLSKIYRRLRFDSKLRCTSDSEKCRVIIAETIALKRCVERINKLPIHLCIVIGETESKVSFHHLARILGWCIAVGIPYVSFYDHDGFLKHNQNVLRTEYEKVNPKIEASIDWESGTSSTKLPENGSNGFKRPTRVQIFSNEDGKGEIVKLVHNLSLAVSHGLLKVEEINTELLEDKLRLENTPDPDLAFVCGSALSTYGLLPWHTRITEFFVLRSHRDVSITDFTFLLEKYGMCEQRYGK